MLSLFKRFPFTIKSGYQTYQLWPDKLSLIEGKQGQDQKFKIIKPLLDKHVAGRTVLDIGTSNGFYSFYAALHRAQYVIGLDKEDTKIGGRDLSYLREIAKKCSIKNIQFITEDFAQFKHAPFDVVLCFAVIHHLYYYSSVEKFKNFSGLLQYITDFTKKALLIEWVDVRGGGPYQNLKPYKKQDFLSGLCKHFKRVNFIGETHKYSENRRLSRELYECLK